VCAAASEKPVGHYLQRGEGNHHEVLLPEGKKGVLANLEKKNHPRLRAKKEHTEPHIWAEKREGKNARCLLTRREGKGRRRNGPRIISFEEKSQHNPSPLHFREARVPVHLFKERGEKPSDISQRKGGEGAAIISSKEGNTPQPAQYV